MHVGEFSKTNNYSLEVIDQDSNRCRYHRRGFKYSPTQIVPKGLCPEAFHSIYPFALGLLYHANTSDKENRNSFLVRCPEGSVIFEVRRVAKKFLKHLEFQLKKVISVFYSVDLREYDILISVVESGDECLRNHRVGQEFEFNQEKQSELCPAAFDSIFPFVYASVSSKENAPKDCFLSCQDHLTNIVFGLNANQQKSNIGNKPKADKKQLQCEQFNNIWIRIKTINGRCSFDFKEGQEFQFKNTVPNGICISAFHNVYPYVFTLEKGGYFTFSTRDKNSIIVQCPSPEGRVAMEVVRDNKNNKNHFTVIQTKGTCPMDMKIGSEIVLPDIFSKSASFPFCPKLFDAIFPYVSKLNLRNENKPITVSCPNYPDNVIIEVYKKEG